MLRRSVLLLITLLALQFSWSVLAAYCMHESGSAAQHLGHHPDSDNGHSVAQQDSSPDAKKSSPHTHCASCAHGTLSIDSLDGIAPPHFANAAPLASVAIPSSRYTAPPERPQWHKTA
ncbi:hypothetical protein GJ699_18855 [Duganella sp. FT80W]|uniref:DUF2946 domain-containing protein n=1 Tax=Duganella guangzhouensis TaxID=2666084 RepID=A0A6I2L1L8_9BURK|nr:hypothetical protein [Duganella guangzhouensis]MRW92058.1 hypothetical protein [Duganella guangzhouensis]